MRFESEIFLNGTREGGKKNVDFIVCVFVSKTRKGTREVTQNTIFILDGLIAKAQAQSN